MRALFVFLFLIGSFCSFGQKLVNEQFDDASLKHVFTVLENKYGLNLAYDPVVIFNIKVTANIEQQTIDNALSRILRDTPLTFSRVKENYYAISPSKNVWKLKGTILDETGAAVPFAKLRVRNTYKGTYSNMKGEYELEHRSEIAPIIEISSLGYKGVLISADKLDDMRSLVLRPDIVDYPEMVIEYLTQGISISNDVSSVSVRPQKLGSVPGTTEPDVFQLVQNVPGINSSSSMVNEIQIRGGTADQNHILWDDIPIYHPGHFNGMVSSVNPNIIDKVELHRSVYDPYFGGKASGLINLHSIDRIPQRYNATAGINMLQADLFALVPIKEKVAVMVSGRRSYIDLWKSPTYNRYADRVYQHTEILNSGSYVQEPEFTGDPVERVEVSNEFRYSDLNGKVIYQPDSNNLLTASTIYTSNILDYSANSTMNNEEINNQTFSSNVGAGIRHSYRWNKRWKSETRTNFAQYAYYSLFEFSENSEDEKWRNRDEKLNAVWHLDNKINATFTPDDIHQLNFGYQLTYNEVFYGLLSSEQEDSITEKGTNDGWLNNLHINYQFKKNKWLAKVGVRGTHLTSNSQFYAEPRIHLQYKIGKQLTLKTSFGIQNQFISQVDQFDESLTGLSNRVWVMAGDSVIPVVSTNITDIGAVWNWKGWYFEAEVYYKRLHNIVLFSSSKNQSSGLIRGNAKAAGIDILIKKRWKNFRSWISYSLSGAAYQFDAIHPTPFQSPFNQRHNVRLVSTFNWRRFEFSAAFKIASGKAYTPITGIAEVPNDDPDADPEELYTLVFGKPFSKSLPLFHQLDATLLYSFPKNPDKRWNLKIGVSCFNVYNRRNVLSRNYILDINDDDLDFPIAQAYAIDKYYLTITPNALIRVTFD